MYSLPGSILTLTGRRALAGALAALAFAAACESITDNDDDGDVEIRIANESGVDFDRVDVGFLQGLVEYGGIPAGTTTDYRPVDVAYRYAYISVEVNGSPYVLQPIDYVGETPLRAGRYTYALSLLEPSYVLLTFRTDD